MERAMQPHDGMQTPRIEGLTPSDLRDAIVAQHGELRGLVTSAVEAAERAARAPGTVESLQRAALTLYEALATHMAFEDRALAAALRDVIGWGDVIERQMEADHRRQRESLAAAAAAAGSGELTARELAETVRLFADTLLIDMESEERGLLEADLDVLIVETKGG